MKKPNLSIEQKNAIENLLILADYIKQHAIYSGEMEKIIDKSIEHCEFLIGKKSEIKKDFESERQLIVDEIKKRFDS